MSKLKSIKKKENIKSVNTLVVQAPLTSMMLQFMIGIIVMLGVMQCVYFINDMAVKNGMYGFPLDDPWIHLNFARNLHLYGSFSYFKNIDVTAGSTSPLYTLILSLMYFISSNEFMISYFLGILFFAFSIYFIFRLAELEIKENWIPLAIALIFAFQPKMVNIAVSGMETTLFIFLIILAFYTYKRGLRIQLGLVLGCILWTRPDGIIVWIAIILDYLLSKYYLKNTQNYKTKDFSIEIGLAVFIAILYFLYNFVISGTFFPNTYAAKLTFYKQGDRAKFLSDEVISFFTSGEFIILWIPLIATTLLTLYNFVKKKNTKYLLYLMFIYGFILTYYIKLPYSHRFGRYLLPILPFYIYSSVGGLREIFELIENRSKVSSKVMLNGVFFIFIGSQLVLGFNKTKPMLMEYIDYCNYHNQRFNKAAIWIKNNAPANAVIGTHDVGALAYYGERRLYDMVGLITPHVVSHFDDENFNTYLEKDMAKSGVTYLAVFDSWFVVDNELPEYVPIEEPEIVRVFKFIPGKTHLINRRASDYNNAAIMAFQNGDPQQALSLLQKSLTYDTLASKTHLILGNLLYNIKDYDKSFLHLKKCLELFPESPEGNYLMSRYLYFIKNDVVEAKKFAEISIKSKPNFKDASEFLDFLRTKQ